jgi:hypothetical protein
MLSEDFDQEFSMYKYQGLLINPEGFKEIEKHINPTANLQKYKESQPFESGLEADRALKRMKEPEDDGIELG